jgi:putative transposase
VVVAGANVPDDRLLEATIEAMVLERPEPEPDWPQHLVLDAGYDTPTGWEATVDHDYYPTSRPADPRIAHRRLTRRTRHDAGWSR